MIGAKEREVLRYNIRCYTDDELTMGLQFCQREAEKGWSDPTYDTGHCIIAIAIIKRELVTRGLVRDF